MSQWLTVWRAAQLLGVRARRAAAAGARRRAEAERWPGLHRRAAAPVSGGAARSRGFARTRCADQGRGLRQARARAPAAQPGSAGAAPVSAEPGAGRRAPPPAALPRAGDRAASSMCASLAASRAGRHRAASISSASLDDGLAQALATEPVDLLDVMDDMLKVMSAQVTVRPSGHEFTVEGHDTLLQAGIARRAQAQLRLRQRQLRHVQGARDRRRGARRPALRLPAVAGRDGTGLHAGLRAHARRAAS